MGYATELSSRKLSSVLLIVAAVVGLVGNAMHPHTVDVDAAAALRGVGESGTWVWIHFVIITAVLLLMGGLVGFAHALEDSPAAPLARLAGATSLVGGAFVCVSTSIDGFGRKALALSWSGATPAQSGTALQVALGAELLGGALWTLAILVFFGAAFICFGAAANASGRYPALFGWTAIVAGLLSVSASVLRIAANGDQQLSESIFLASSITITIWAFVLGVMMWRGVRPESPVKANAVVGMAGR